MYVKLRKIRCLCVLLNIVSPMQAVNIGYSTVLGKQWLTFDQRHALMRKGRYAPLMLVKATMVQQPAAHLSKTRRA